LLDACGQLAKDDLEFTLLLVGDFEPRERDYWWAEIDRCGIQDRVRVTGMMDRMQALAHLSLIDIFAVPSVHDGCPNAMLEAMLAGKAIIGTSIDAIGEILTQGHCGLVVPPACSSELERALRTLIDQPHLRQRLGMAARSMALQQLSPAVEQENWLKVYQWVLASRRLQVSQISPQISLSTAAMP
jgi:glycosyltransferase involved in cell wall biosynthesis